MHSQAAESPKNEFPLSLRQRFGDKQSTLDEVPRKQVLPVHTATPFPRPYTFCRMPAWLARISSRLAPVRKSIGKQVASEPDPRSQAPRQEKAFSVRTEKPPLAMVEWGSLSPKRRCGHTRPPRLWTKFPVVTKAPCSARKLQTFVFVPFLLFKSGPPPSIDLPPLRCGLQKRHGSSIRPR